MQVPPNNAHHGEGSPSTLKYVFSCLSSRKTSPKVCECVMGIAVNLLTLGGSEEEGGGGQGDGWQAAMDANEDGGRRGADEEGTMGAERGEGAADAGSEGRSRAREGSGFISGETSSGEELLSPFLPCLLAYLNRVISEKLGKRGRVREDGRSLESEFVVLSR